MESINNSKFKINQILKGLTVSIVLSIVLLLIYSIVLTYTNCQESTIPTVTIIITGVSIIVRKFY